MKNKNFYFVQYYTFFRIFGRSVVHKDTAGIESRTPTACSFWSIPGRFDLEISFNKLKQNHFSHRLSDIRSRFLEQLPKILKKKKF